MDQQMETAQLLARFKLQVKRSLGESVDLERLTREPDYALQRLKEIEEAAEDIDLLVMVVRLRDTFAPSTNPTSPSITPSTTGPSEAEIISSKETRNYLMGARAW